MKFIVILLILSSNFFSCHENEYENERSVIWSRSSFTEPDPIPWGPDSTFSNYNFHMISFVQINEKSNCILINRDSFGSPRKIYNIRINDSLKKIIFDLSIDSTVIKYKEARESPPRVLYCGPIYDFAFIVKGDTTFISYSPMDEETKIYKLNKLFESLFKDPDIIGIGNIDTIKMDSILKNNKAFYPPPMRPSVKYTPPK